MSDLLNFDDDEDNLFKPQERQEKPSKSLDDIFGTNSESNLPTNTLDDILTPSVQDEIFETKSKSPKEKASAKNVDDLFGGDVDAEPDIFSAEFAPKQKNSNVSSPLEADLLGDFLTPPSATEKGHDLFDDEDKAIQNSNSIDDLFATNQSQSVSTSNDQSKQRTRSADRSHSESDDSLDMILDAQPLGTVPSCDDLLSLVEPISTNTASSNLSVSPNSNTKDSQKKESDPLGDFFGTSDPQPEVLSEEKEKSSKLSDDPEQVSDPPEELEDIFKPLEDKEQVEPDSDTEEKAVTKPKTNLKKSMERSFEDLLNGLSDESEPELDEMIEGDIDNTNLESLLESPNKSVRETREENSVFTTPNKPADLDFVTSTPMERSADSPEVKVTTPEVKVLTPEDEEIQQEELEVEEDEANTFDDSDVVMRPKKQYTPDTVDGDELNLEAVEDTNHLDVDVNKHKSALGKTGSMALRRKPSRKSRKSLLSTDEDALFRDSTDSKAVDMPNGTAGDVNSDNDDDNYDLSPPAKKPSPAILVPLPGMAGRPPSQRKSASSPNEEDDNAMDTKEVKRLSKPPPGAFVLPSFGSRPQKQSSPSPTEKPPIENKPAVFEKPALKSVKPVEKSPSPEADQSPGFSRAGLRSTERLEEEKKSGSEERDVTFQVPSLRSTPKPSRERTPEEKMDTGVFEKPALRSTPRANIEQKHSEAKESDTGIFESKNLRSVTKTGADAVKETTGDKHVFDKPSLRSTGRRLGSETDTNIEEASIKTFDKPALRTTNKDFRSDSLNESSEHSHTFDKPSLRSTSRTNSESNKPDTYSQGTFDKPSLKKTTPSPEKETKDSNEPKGTFDKPALRRTEGLKNREKPVTSEKPEWLQQAANKHSKVLEMMHTKENQQGHVDKEVPSWLEKSPLKKTRALPLQDTSNSQSTSSSQSDLSNVEDHGRVVTTPRSRNSSVSSEKETERKRPSVSTAKENHNNYTPSWLRQTRSPSVPNPGILGPAKSLPSLTSTNEVPQWKKELAQRRANRKETTPEEVPKKDEPSEPDWKKGIALRKTRNSAQPSKEVKSVEPEWKKAAEEKHARLRNSSLHGPADQLGQL